jgi:hypothetical protein
MKIYKYKNYDEYMYNQVEANHQKAHMIFVDKKSINAIYGDLKKQKNPIKNILCHGTRGGAEQRFFKQYYPEAKIIGTEVGYDHAPMTVKWDFNKENILWKGKMDLVYSNSIDHAFNPYDTLSVWKDQLAPKGKLYLEISTKLNSRKWDPVEMTSAEFKTLFDSLDLKIDNEWISSGLKDKELTTIYALRRNT